MYNTVREVYIAIDSGLQQVNTNRKQVFKPEQYDFIVNDTILQYINDKIDPKSNPKQDGFEDTQRRVDELKDLKKSLTLRFYNDSVKTKYTTLPSDYYRLIAGGCEVYSHYNKRRLALTENIETSYYYTLSFPSDGILNQGSSLYSNFTISSGFFTKDYTKLSYHKDSKFEIINYYIDYFRKELNLNAYWEYYNNIYYKDCFVIVPNSRLTSTIELSYTNGDAQLVTQYSLEIEKNNTYNTTTGNIISSAIELISSKQKIEINNNYYLSKNRITQPTVTLDNNKLHIYHDSTFTPLTINIEYIIKPKLINYYYNTMPELEINEEIIKRVIDKLKVFIKDEQAYNMFNNQVQRIQ